MLPLATRGILSQTKIYGLGLASRGHVEVGFLSVLSPYDLVGKADLTHGMTGQSDLTRGMTGKADLTTSVTGKGALTITATGKADLTIDVTGKG